MNKDFKSSACDDSTIEIIAASKDCSLDDFNHAFSDLLSPLSAQVFLRDYWQSKPLFIKGAPDKFSHLFSFEEFQKAIKAAGQLVNPSGFRIAIFVRDKSLTFTEVIEAEELPAWLEKGATVCVNAINMGDDRLSRYASAVREQMSYPGAVRFNCYLSPDGSGADTHFDSRVSTTLQIEGKKRWRFSPQPAIAWPPSNAQLRNGKSHWMAWDETLEWSQLKDADESGFEEVVLEPGDLLCLPAGTWHTAKAIGQSLALNLTFSPFSFFDFLTQLLQPELISRAEWRGMIPPVDAENVNREQLPEEIDAYVRERLSEVCALLENLDSTHVNRVWRELIDYEVF